MLKPLDIQNKEFSRSFRGYNENEVDEFLDKIIEDYEKLTNENIELKEKNRLLLEQLEKYNNLENTLKETLIMAQTTAEEVTANAKKEAELIIQEAEEKGRKIIEAANQEALKVQQEYENTKRDLHIFKTRFKTLLEAQLDALNESFKDII